MEVSLKQKSIVTILGLTKEYDQQLNKEDIPTLLDIEAIIKKYKSIDETNYKTFIEHLIYDENNLSNIVNMLKKHLGIFKNKEYAYIDDIEQYAYDNIIKDYNINYPDQRLKNMIDMDIAAKTYTENRGDCIMYNHPNGTYIAIYC